MTREYGLTHLRSFSHCTNLLASHRHGRGCALRTKMPHRNLVIRCPAQEPRFPHALCRLKQGFRQPASFLLCCHKSTSTKLLIQLTSAMAGPRSPGGKAALAIEPVHLGYV